jgi:hypothetical protein
VVDEGKEEEDMTPAQFERLDTDQATALLQWRFQRLTDAGHEPVGALLLSVRPEIGLGLASALLQLAQARRVSA